jgi:tRNA modification GTPase
MTDTDTVFALATPPGRGAVAVMRVSGPRAAAAVTALTGKPPPAPRVAARRRLSDPATGDRLDDALVLWFAAPASYTGEDVAEFQLHGGRAVASGVIETLNRLEGFRGAEAGEFTRRAFANGKLDLTEAEAVADLIDAQTAAQRRQALRQMDGRFGALCDVWRDRLIRALAHAEADIDFSDENLPDGLEATVAASVRDLRGELARFLDDGRRGERLRDGLSVAIVGAPNAGKSSLLNALAGREAAIVSSRAGTTRDVIEVQLDLGGFPVILADTAGLRETADEIEEEGVRRALARAEAADLRLAVFDATRWPDTDAATRALLGPDTVAVLNKTDAAPADEASLDETPLLAVSARTGDGLAALEARLIDAARDRLDAGDGAAMTRARHRKALEDCRAALDRALAAALPELAAEDLRLAARALGRITGRVDVEDLLDVIFRDFCIGK